MHLNVRSKEVVTKSLCHIRVRVHVVLGLNSGCDENTLLPEMTGHFNM